MEMMTIVLWELLHEWEDFSEGPGNDSTLFASRLEALTRLDEDLHFTMETMSEGTQKEVTEYGPIKKVQVGDHSYEVYPVFIEIPKDQQAVHGDLIQARDDQRAEQARKNAASQAAWEARQAAKLNS